MKHIFVILITLIPILGQAQAIRKVNKTATGVEISLHEGILNLQPLSDNAFRVRFTENVTPAEPSLIFNTECKIPDFKLSETSKGIEVSIRSLNILVNRSDGAITFKDSEGKTLLHEKPGSRLIKPCSISGEKCMMVQQSFISPEDEYLFGTGQFQDGFLNVKGLTRRLTQVNSQISIPFIVSSKGYGLLWNNYGLTDFNPADSKAELTHVNETGETITVEVRTSEGSRKETRQNSGFAGSFEVAKKGRYAILLDVGQDMARKYNVVMDNKEVINFNNYWLPPTTSTFVELEAGTHKVLINGEKNDKPVLYYRLVTDETTFRSPVAKALDYVVFAGKADEVIARWMKTNGECIFSTRPWKIFGEGPAQESEKPLKAQGFNEGGGKPFSSFDFRFTTKGNTLYTIALGWPEDGKALIKSLSKGNSLRPEKINQVEFLGRGELKFERKEEGLEVILPDNKPDLNYAFSLKIS